MLSVELGLQAAQRVMNTSPQLALKVLKDTAQNLPMQAKSLYRLQVDKELRKEVASNQKVSKQRALFLDSLSSA